MSDSELSELLLKMKQQDAEEIHKHLAEKEARRVK